MKPLILVSLLALAGSFLSSLAAGSHFNFSLANNSFNFDFGIGAASTPAAVAFGVIAVLAFLAALFMGASGTPPGDSGAAPAPPTVPQMFSNLGRSLRGLTTSSKDCMIGGVCGGLGKYTPLPSWVWRVLFLVLLLCYGTGFLAYVILWICLPAEANASEGLGGEARAPSSDPRPTP